MDYTIFTSNVLENTVIEEKEVISYWHDPYENVLVIVFPLLSLERQWELSDQYGIKKTYSYMLKQQLPYFLLTGYLEVYKAVPSFGWAVAEKLPYEWEEAEMVVKESHPSGFEPGVEIPELDAEVIPYLPLGITSAVEVALLGKEILDQALTTFLSTLPERVCPKQLSKSKKVIKEFGYSDLEIEFLTPEMILEIAEFVESLDK